MKYNLLMECGNDIWQLQTENISELLWLMHRKRREWDSAYLLGYTFNVCRNPAKLFMQFTPGSATYEVWGHFDHWLAEAVLYVATYQLTINSYKPDVPTCLESLQGLHSEYLYKFDKEVHIAIVPWRTASVLAWLPLVDDAYHREIARSAKWLVQDGRGDYHYIAADCAQTIWRDVSTDERIGI